MLDFYDIVLKNGNKTRVYWFEHWVGQRHFTFCTLHFPPGMFATPGFYSGQAIMAPSDVYNRETGRRLAFKRAWDSVLRANNATFSKKQWQWIRRARWEAEKSEAVNKF